MPYCRVMIETTTRGPVYRKDFDAALIFAPIVEAFASALVSQHAVQPGEHYRALITPGYGDAAVSRGMLWLDSRVTALELPAWLNLVLPDDGQHATEPLSYFTLELRFVESGVIYRQDLGILTLGAFWSNVQAALVRMRVLQEGEVYYPRLFIRDDDAGDFEHEEVHLLAYGADDAVVEIVAPSEEGPQFPVKALSELPVIDTHSVKLIGAEDEALDGEAAQDTLRIYIAQDVLSALQAIARSEVQVEQGGMLVGEVYRRADDPDRLMVVITDHVVAQGTSASLVELRYTFESWLTSAAQVRERFPGKRIVGWYHTHLVHLAVRDESAADQTTQTDLFFSSDDHFVQRQFFREPWYVAMVLGQRGRAVFYRWFGDVISANAIFYVIAPQRSP